MKNLLLLICLFFFYPMLSQKKYSFDYGLEYNFEEINMKPSKPKIFLINSHENNFYLHIYNLDSLNFAVNFYDHEGLMINSKMNKNAFFKAETINNDCTNILRNIHNYNYDYYFVNYNDTIIKDTLYHHYALKSNKSIKYQKKKKINTVHYIVYKTKYPFLPFFFGWDLYEKWKKTKSIPNGLLKIAYYVDTEGVEKARLTLKSITKIEKYLTLPEECDYTKLPIPSQQF